MQGFPLLCGSSGWFFLVLSDHQNPVKCFRRIPYSYYLTINLAVLALAHHGLHYSSHTLLYRHMILKPSSGVHLHVMIANLADQSGRPGSTLPTYWSPAASYFKYVSCISPIVHPASRFVASCRGAHVDPEDIYPAAPFWKLRTPRSSTLIPKSLSISSLYFSRIFSKLFENRLYWLSPRKSDVSFVPVILNVDK